MSRTTAFVLAATIVALIVGAWVVESSEAASCDRTCRALAAQPPRELGWYWWPGVAR